MKPLLLLLALSLAANAALLIKRSRVSSSAPESASSAASSPSVASSSSALVERSPTFAPSSASAGPITIANSAQRPFWDKILAGDASAIEQLHAAGWPRHSIVTLVSTVLQESYRDRFKAFRGDAPTDRYWTAESFFGNMDPAKRKAANELWREQTALAKKLLGPDHSEFYGEQSWRNQSYAALPAEKAAVVRHIESDYNLLLQDVRSDFASMGGPTLMLPEDREKIAFLEKEKRADLAKALTPEELLDYDLRSSPIASTLRNGLEAFEPTEAEFRALFSIQQETAERLGYVQSPGRPSQKDQELSKQMQTEVDARAKQLLSEQRYADYTRSKDMEYRRLYQLGKRLDLPSASINAAHEVKVDAEKRIQELMKSPEAKNRDALVTASSAIADEAEARMKQALGDRGYEVYAANNGYIASLRRSRLPPPPRPASPTSTPAAK